MRRASVMGLAMIVAVSIACGKSAEQKAAEQAAENAKVAADQMKKAAESAAAAGNAAAAAGTAASLEGFAKAMSGMAGKGPDGKVVEPVSFRDLQTALPEISGWKRDEPKGERMTMPVPFSQTETDYTMGDARVNVKIVDTAYNQILVAPLAMFLTAGYEKESSTGFEKSMKIGENPSFERWDKADKDGELTMVVANRFLVTIHGNDIADTKILEEFGSKIDATKLAGLK